MNYYNENNPDAAAWLRELIRAGHIAPGFVDERSIVDVKANELGQYTQVHFFAGIGGWSLALRLAGWPDGVPVWTGSCPCQPFSVAGKGKVDKDERNLWPAFRAAITVCKPAIIFGEQVASPDGRIWLAGVRTDVEALGYGLGAADLCAAGISAPMVSQRLHWMATNDRSRRSWPQLSVRPPRQNKTPSIATRNGESHVGSPGSGLATPTGSERRSPTKGRKHVDNRKDAGREEAASGCGICGEVSLGVAAPDIGAGKEKRADTRRGTERSEAQGIDERPVCGGNGFGMAETNRYHEHWWSGPLQVGWNCIEAEVERGGRKYRAQWRVKPGIPLLADGIPNRVAQLCGFGNAIVPQLAATFIQACDELISANNRI